MSKRKNYSNYYNEKKNEDEIAKVEDVEATETTETIESIKETVPVMGVVVNCSKLNVRKEPNLGSQVITELDKGTTVELINDTVLRDFRKVKVNGVIGYCMSFYIEEIK